jgi:thioesterase domain-containing protein
MARQLKGTNISVKKLFLLDSFATFAQEGAVFKNKFVAALHRESHKKFFDLKLLIKHPNILKDIKHKSFSKKINDVLIKVGFKTNKSNSTILQRINKIKAMHVAASREYPSGFYEGEIILLRAKVQTKYFFDPEFLGWKGLSESIRIIEVEGMHSEMFSAPNDAELAAIIKKII